MGKDILNIYCPSCGAPAEFDIVNQRYCCSYCGGTVKLEKVRHEQEAYQLKLHQQAVHEFKKYPLTTTCCTGCGATLVFEENEALSSCDFCGRKLVRRKYTQAEEVPQAVIPFALTREEAWAKLLDWCEKNKQRPEAKLLTKKQGELKGYYLPYRMARGPVYCEVSKMRQGGLFHAGGYLHEEFVNCSSQLDNLVLDAMEPYDLTALKEFDYAYVAGQKVKISDISDAEATKRLAEEVNANYRVSMEKIWGTKAINMKTKVEATLQYPVLLPVYYIRDGEVSAAVNGQTGKVSVRQEKPSLYVSIPWWLEALALFIAACALVSGIGYLTSGNLAEALIITGILGFFYLFIFCFMFDPGLDNSIRMLRYHNILTSGEQTFRREKGRLVPRETSLKRKIADPIFTQKLHGKDTEVTYVFRSPVRILSMVFLAVGVVFLPVILALFVNGFDFSKLTLGGSAVWFCITVPTAPIVLIQTGLKELYSSPWIYTFTKDGKKKRWREDSMKPWKLFLGLLRFLLLHPLGWIALGVMGVMVYLTAYPW